MSLPGVCLKNGGGFPQSYDAGMVKQEACAQRYKCQMEANSEVPDHIRALGGVTAFIIYRRY